MPVSRPPLRIAVVGHVDHGKSTLVGCLLHTVGALPEGRIDAIRAMCDRRGMPFEWAFVTDALQAERDQGVTVDASHARFRRDGRDYVLIDAPGHREFLKNMISGAADCDAALVVIDAEEGVREQSRRHAFMLHLLGVREIAVAVTKMDRVDYAEARFAEVRREFREILDSLDIADVAFVPVSGREGDNIAVSSPRMPWHRGGSVIDALGRLTARARLVDQPLRLPVQDVYKFDTRRILAGRIESGRLRVGDRIVISPANHAVAVRAIEGWAVDGPIVEAVAGQSVGITLDEQVFVERGDVISHIGNPAFETNIFRGRLFWLGRVPLVAGAGYTLRINTAETPVTVERIERVVDTALMTDLGDVAVPPHAVADVILRGRATLALDAAGDLPRTGRFVLIDGRDIVGGGLVDLDGFADQRAVLARKATNIARVAHRVTPKMRGARAGHEGGVVWFTGLSGSGKSTLATELELRLFRSGYQVYVLDGDNLRHGLNANLGFSPEDRAENIRRAGEVAALMARAGFLVVTAFISPYRADRARARHAAAAFHEIHIRADLATCEARDPKGLYRKARAGEIVDFTGVSAPYEAPEACELAVDTADRPVAESVGVLLGYVQRAFPLDRDAGSGPVAIRAVS
ncbi:MAG: adenylyl-sulfate kinase [Alphaproteobacteria bacterium]